MAKHFTKKEIDEIEQALVERSRKDSSFPSTDVITNDDTVPVVQDGINKQINVNMFKTYLQNGPQGESAYEVAVRHGYTGTEEEWISSLKGETGDKGDKGDTGEQGEKGDKGEQGLPGVDHAEAIIPYGDTPGTPSASVSFNEDTRELSFQFRHLKGEKGDPAEPVEHYFTVEATSGMEWADVLALLPEEGSADTLYRVACWDGTQYDDTTYSVYGWDGENYKFLEKKEPGIDDEPTPNSENLVKSGGVTATLGGYSTHPEFIRAITDASGRFIVGIKFDGSIVFGAGCPQQIVDYINEYGYDKQAVDAILSEKVDKETGKELVNSEIADSLDVSNTPRWLSATTDKNGKLLSGIDEKGDTFVKDIYTSNGKNPVMLSELTEDHIFCDSYLPTSQTSTVVDDLLLRRNQVYTVKVEFIQAPDSDVVVNVWPTKKSNGDWSRIVVSGSNTFNQIAYAEIDTRGNDNDELYKFTCRAISGSSTEIRVTVFSALYAPAISSNSPLVLPNYYYGYLRKRIFEIQKSIFDMGSGDVFGFLTDTHPSARSNKWCGRILRYLGERVPIRKVFFGGDICPSRPSAYGTGVSAKDSAVYAEIEQRERLDSVINGYMALYKARGNHDYAISEGSTSFHTNSWQATRKATRHFLVNDADGSIVGDDSRVDSCYYYFDNAIQKIRYIVADTSDWTDTKTGTSNVTMKISDAQMIWLIENAILTTPDGYKIVVMSHVPLADVAYIYNDDSRNEQTIKTLKDVLCAVNKKEVIEVPLVSSASRIYDFTQMNVNVVLCIAGHLHGDAQTYEDGILFYTSHCDSCTTADYSYLEKQLFGIFSQKAIGTIYENLVNIVSIDTTNNIVKVFRFGVGVDKIFNLEQKHVSVGESIRLYTSIANPVWVSHDSTGVNDDYSTNPDTGDAFLHTHSSIGGSTGLLTGLSAGSVVAVAYSKTDNTMEFFNVIVG